MDGILPSIPALFLARDPPLSRVRSFYIYLPERTREEIFIAAKSQAQPELVEPVKSSKTCGIDSQTSVLRLFARVKPHPGDPHRMWTLHCKGKCDERLTTYLSLG